MGGSIGKASASGLICSWVPPYEGWVLPGPDRTRDGCSQVLFIWRRYVTPSSEVQAFESYEAATVCGSHVPYCLHAYVSHTYIQ